MYRSLELALRKVEEEQKKKGRKKKGRANKLEAYMPGGRAGGAAAAGAWRGKKKGLQINQRHTVRVGGGDTRERKTGRR